MHLDRLTTGEGIAGVSAVVLFVSTFFDWFVVRIPDTTGVNFFLDGTGQSAWDALDYTPIVLTVAVAAALAVVVLRLTDWVYAPPVPANAAVAILGIISVLLILFRIVDPPSFGSFQGFFGTVSAERTVQYGIFVGLLAATGIAFGGYRAMREEGISSSNVRADRHRDQTPQGRGR